MGSSSSVSKKNFKTQTDSKPKNEAKEQLEKKKINTRMDRKSIIRNNSRDEDDSLEKEDKISLKQQNQQEIEKQESMSEFNEDLNVPNKYDYASRQGSKAQININPNANINSRGSRNIQKQHSFRSPSYVQFQQEHYYKHKAAVPAASSEKRLFGDFYVGNTQSSPDKNTTANINNNPEDASFVQNKSESLKKKEEQQNQIRDQKQSSKEMETNKIVEIKERNQNFFAKGNVILAVNQFNNYKSEKIQNQDDYQSQLLKQLLELGIQPTSYILNNSIKYEYEEKKNQLSKYEDYGSKNQRNKNAQKVQIITYPGFQEILQSKNIQSQNKNTPSQSKNLISS